ncbi:MAG: NAD(+) diphosphatase [Treponema sp.]|nr:NAD(+) diphosphatase [Treponema sp.]
MSAVAFFFQNDSLLMPVGKPSSAAEPEIPLAFAEEFPFSDVFSIPGITDKGLIYCVSIPSETILPTCWQAVPVRQIISQETGLNSRMLRAFHIAQWRRESRFCGSCGKKNLDAPGELARLCPACGRMEFPRITPAVITIIMNDKEQILLAHNKKFTPGMYSLIAGFAEAGETLEEAVFREIYEETGIKTRDTRYITSQPWPFPNSLMAGFSARYESGSITPDGIEIDDARWFSRNNLPTLPRPGSVSRLLIDAWQKGRL